MNLVRKCRKCGQWIYIIEKEVGDRVRCQNCGEEHKISKTLSEKIVITRIWHGRKMSKKNVKKKCQI